MPTADLSTLRKEAEGDADKSGQSYEEYRADIAVREAKMGIPGPSCTEETYSQHPPNSPVGGGDRIARIHDEVCGAFERVSLRAGPENRVDDEEALAASKQLIDRLDSVNPVPESHPRHDEVRRTRHNISENARIITACITRYPRDGPRGVVMPRGSGKLVYEAGQRLTHDAKLCLEVLGSNSEDQLYARPGTGAEGLLVDGSGNVNGDAMSAAQEWARSVIGKAVLGGDAEAWHEGQKMSRHSWHAAAAEWHDLMEWIGACQPIRDLFVCWGASPATSPQKS